MLKGALDLIWRNVPRPAKAGSAESRGTLWAKLPLLASRSPLRAREAHSTPRAVSSVERPRPVGGEFHI